jgi:hypothetical protein
VAELLLDSIRFPSSVDRAYTCNQWIETSHISNVVGLLHLGQL